MKFRYFPFFLLVVTWVSSFGADPIPQDAVQIGEVVSGDIIPIIKDDESGNQTIAAAKASYGANCDSWRKSQADLAGESFLLADCGNVTHNVAVYSSGYDQREFGAGLPGQVIGWVTQSQGTVVFEGPGNRLTSMSVLPVSSETIPYLKVDASAKATALFAAQKQYRERCDNWRKQVKKELGNHFIFATCDGVVESGKMSSAVRIADNTQTRTLRLTAHIGRSKVYFLTDLSTP